VAESNDQSKIDESCLADLSHASAVDRRWKWRLGILERHFPELWGRSSNAV
jgi:hypothetical protein